MAPENIKRQSGRKTTRRGRSATTPHDGDVFVIPIGSEKAYLGQVIATPNYVETYIVIFDLLISEKDASQYIDEALASSPLLAGLAICPFKVSTWEIITNRQLTSQDADRFLPAYFARVRGKGIVEDFYGERSRPASSDEAAAAYDEIMNRKNGLQRGKSITLRRSTSAATFEAALRAINGLEP
ncbi:Imm26 family immunity protein [Propionibacterium australiense]|uniref:Imm26 family immunity protein n=1 Tax=Propionibacterium australiense TaxID=119981 RepID=UPI000E5C339E|nr:Imm26 family immunity protein [Propionibacterium australiense]RLP05879.1 hypothetical protein D9T14_13110 [Propionibacterium australiense]